MMKKILLTVFFVLSLLLPACTEAEILPKDVGGKIYVCEEDGFGGDFIISLYGDGTFSYSAGPLSSYIGYGSWTLEDGTITLTDVGMGDRESVYVFEYERGELVFEADGSDSFMYVALDDGARFSVMTELESEK